MAESINYTHWEDSKIVQEQFLTLGEFLDFPIGHSFDVLLLDRNVFDIACNNKVYDTDYKAVDFFRKNKTRIEKTGEFNWKMYWDWDIKGQCLDQAIEILHPDIKVWNPTKEGYYEIDEDEIDLFLPRRLHDEWLHKKIHYSDFNRNTRIGWRGDMILWDKVINLPDVHYYNILKGREIWGHVRGIDMSQIPRDCDVNEYFENLGRAEQWTAEDIVEIRDMYIYLKERNEKNNV